MSKELVDILKKSKLFSGFDSEQIDQVVSHLKPKVKTYKSGEQIYKKGDPADRCWLIQSGDLTMKRASLRSPFLKMIFNKGSVTGIQGLADPGSKRAVTMIAEDKSVLIEITHEGISQLDRKAEIQLWKNVSKLLFRKLAACLSRETLD